MDLRRVQITVRKNKVPARVILTALMVPDVGTSVV